jgi:CheY-like chemotaxis protein
MRPKKKILLVGASKDRLSILKFMLHTNGYAVTEVLGAEEAVEQLRAQTYDLLFCDHWTLPGIDLLLDRAWKIDSAMHSLVLAPNLTASPEGLNADVVLLRGGCSSVALLEWMKRLTARKRGPRSIRKRPLAVSVPLMPMADRRLA